MKNRSLKTQEITKLFIDLIESNELLGLKSNGFYSGNFGVLFFLAHLSGKTSDTQHSFSLGKYADECFNNFSRKTNSFTFHGGLSGILACLNFLNKSSLLNIDYSDIEVNCKKYLYQIMCNYLESSNYAFFNGALGIAVHFRHDENFIKAVIDDLGSKSIVKDNQISIIPPANKRYREIELGLAKGLPGIITVLCLLYESGYFSDRIRRLITGFINYLNSFEIDPMEHGCFFPSVKYNKILIKNRSSLSWNSGDLRIAITLWKAGNALNNEQWKSKALEIMIFSSSRKDLTSNFVNNASIFNGSAGIALMYDYIFRETGNILFHDTCSYWLEVTLDMAKFPFGYAGYKIIPSDDRPWVEELSLLYGIAGIGLTLSSIGGDENTKEWTQLFLL